MREISGYRKMCQQQGKRKITLMDADMEDVQVVEMGHKRSKMEEVKGFHTEELEGVGANLN